MVRMGASANGLAWVAMRRDCVLQKCMPQAPLGYPCALD